MDLLAAHHRDRDDRRTGAQRDLHEAAAPEPLHAVAVAVALAGALHALREHRYELLLLEQPDRVEGRRWHTAQLAHRHRYVGELERPVQDEEARRAREGVLAHERDAHHHRVPRHDPRVVGHEQGPAVRRHALDALGLHSPPVVEHELEQGQGGLGELLIETPVVFVVAAAEPPHDRVQAVAGVARQRQRGAAERRHHAVAGVEAGAQRAQEADDRRERLGPRSIRRAPTPATNRHTSTASRFLRRNRISM